MKSGMLLNICENIGNYNCLLCLPVVPVFVECSVCMICWKHPRVQCDMGKMIFQSYKGIGNHYLNVLVACCVWMLLVASTVVDGSICQSSDCVICFMYSPVQFPVCESMICYGAFCHSVSECHVCECGLYWRRWSNGMETDPDDISWTIWKHIWLSFKLKWKRIYELWGYCESSIQWTCCMLFMNAACSFCCC